MEKELGNIAEQIAALPDKKLIMIAGPSSSGKTTFSHRLSIQLMAHGLKPHPIAVDNYFVERVDTPKDENGQYNFECLEAMDIELFNEMGKEWARLFADRPVTKILTVEASGIGIACVAAQHFHVPVVFAKKTQSLNIDGEVYCTQIQSFTHKKIYDVLV